MSGSLEICCDEFESAVSTTFANPIDSPSGWLLYGTDYESVSGGHPELRYWPIRYCPFCGASLDLPPREMLRRSRRFGFDE
ncbi:MAG: hypothetical protein IT305_26680 [Chloroflexi bacterium]|nr:hypothetical protein [Chloroflexota bacterium]